MKSDPPNSWSEMGIKEPGARARPGAVLGAPVTQMLVRSYDTTRAFAVSVHDGTSDRYLLDTSLVPVLEPISTPKVNDTIFYLGEVIVDDDINLWSPMRVVWVGAESDGFVPVRTVRDPRIVADSDDFGHLLNVFASDVRG